MKEACHGKTSLSVIGIFVPSRINKFFRMKRKLFKKINNTQVKQDLLLLHK